MDFGAGAHAVLLEKTQQAHVALTAFGDEIKLDALPIRRFVERNSLLRWPR